MNTEKTKQELNVLHGYAEQTPNNSHSGIEVTSESEEVMYGDVAGTPFTIGRVQGLYYLLLKNYRLTEGLKTEAEAVAEAKNMSWNRIIQVMAIIAELHGKATEMMEKQRKINEIEVKS